MIGVSIEMIPTQVGETRDIRLRDRAFVRDHRIADFQLLEVFTERMFVLHGLPGMGLIVIGEGRDHGGRTLDSHPLHIMFYAAQATHFLSSSRPPRPAMH